MVGHRAPFFSSQNANRNDGFTSAIEVYVTYFLFLYQFRLDGNSTLTGHQNRSHILISDTEALGRNTSQVPSPEPNVAARQSG